MAERFEAERQCAECGVTYTAVWFGDASPRLTCSKACARLRGTHLKAAQKRRNGRLSCAPARILVCPTCQKSFKARSTQRYCSKQCRPRRVSLLVESRICKGCAASFEPEHSMQTYCSKGCRPRPVRAHVVRETMTCAECGQEVPRLAPNQKVCSKGCRNRRGLRLALEQKRQVSLGIGHRRYLIIVAERKLEQGGGCAICGRVESSDLPFGLDHDHETGQLRGWLCNPCNAALGFLQDDPALLDAAMAYLTRWKDTSTERQLHLT